MENPTTNSSTGDSQLEIKVMFAKDLWTFNFFQKLSIYAVASISGHPDSKKSLSREQMQEQRTPTDHDGDGYPEWNHLITFDLSPFPLSLSDSNHLPARSELLLRFELRHQTGLPLFPDKTIGEVKVPLAELLDDSVDDGVTRFVDYQVRSPDGKPNGVLRFAYKAPLIQGVGGNGRENNSSFDALGFGISGYSVISDQNPTNSPENFPGLYPHIESVAVPSLVQPIEAKENLTVQSYAPPNPTAYPATQPLPEDAPFAWQYPPPAPTTGGFWLPPPRSYHLHRPPPPPPPLFHPPPPPTAAGHWERPPESQWYYIGRYGRRRGY